MAYYVYLTPNLLKDGKPLHTVENMDDLLKIVEWAFERGAITVTIVKPIGQRPIVKKGPPTNTDETLSFPF